MASFGGADIFGVAVTCQHIPSANEEQTNAFFGVTGTQALYGGGRGRVFEITGLLVGASQADVIAAENTLLSYADGIARDFVDTKGRTWPQVIFKGEFKPDARIDPCLPYGYAMRYSMVLRGLK